MKTSYRAGFTIIETSLFLGITGLLLIGVLATTGASISNQRYRDSVANLKSAFQDQYNQVSATSNLKTDDWRCVGGVVDQGGVGDPRGKSECQIMGRIITSTPDQSRLLFRDLIGYVVPGATNTSLNDIEALRQYTLRPSPIDPTEYRMEWDALLTNNSGAAKNFTVLILRSPSTGVIRTFINPDRLVEDVNLQEVINEDALKAGLEVCVRPNGFFVLGGVLAVGIKSGATSATGVESLGESFNSCQ
jgi:type II secretory pathway pseudopilin PulG